MSEKFPIIWYPFFKNFKFECFTHTFLSILSIQKICFLGVFEYLWIKAVSKTPKMIKLMILIIEPFKKGLKISLDDIEKTHFFTKKLIYKSCILATSSPIKKVKTRKFPQIFIKKFAREEKLFLFFLYSKKISKC